MNQPPNDPYYNAPTEGAGYPQPGSMPGYPPTQAASQPGFPPQSGPYPQQPSAPNYPPTQGPMSQPGFPPPSGPYPQQPSAPNYPPAQGPMSQPGFPQQPGAYPQQGSGPTYLPPQGPPSYPGYPPQGQVPPAWPNMAQPPQGPKKSNKGLIAIISIIVVLVLIVGGVAAALAMRSKGNTANTTATPTSTAATNGTTPTAAATQPGNSTPSTGTSGTLNQPVQAGTDWVITVTKVAANSSGDFPPKAGDTYLEITMSLKNVSATKMVVSSLLQFSLVDSVGGKYDEALTDTNVTKTPDGDVEAGQTLDAQLAYEVPQSQHNFVLAFDYGLLSGSDANVTWQLSV